MARDEESVFETFSSGLGRSIQTLQLKTLVSDKFVLKGGRWDGVDNA